MGSTEFGTTIIGQAVGFFLVANPQIDFEVQLYPSDKLIATQLDFDCMLAFGEPTNSSLLRRKVGDISYGLYASPDFIAANGSPDEIESLNGQNGIVYLRNGIAERWVLQRRRKTVDLRPYARFNVNEYWMAKFFAVQGFAIGYLPDFFVKYELEQGALMSMFSDWRSNKTSLYVVYPAQRHRNPRIMRLIDALCSHFETFISYPGYALIKSDYKDLRSAQAAVSAIGAPDNFKSLKTTIGHRSGETSSTLSTEDRRGPSRQQAISNISISSLRPCSVMRNKPPPRLSYRPTKAQSTRMVASEFLKSDVVDVASDVQCHCKRIRGIISTPHRSRTNRFPLQRETHGVMSFPDSRSWALK